jgi:hypothetical protein
MNNCAAVATCSWFIWSMPANYPAANSQALRIDRSQPATGGVSGYVYNSLLVNGTSGANDAGYLWVTNSNLHNITAIAAGAQNAAVAATAWKGKAGVIDSNAVGPTFSLYASCTEVNPTANPTTACTNEIDWIGQVGAGADTNRQRAGLTVNGDLNGGTDTSAHMGYVLGLGVNHGVQADNGIWFGGMDGAYGIGINFTGKPNAFGTAAILASAAAQDVIGWTDTSGAFNATHGFAITAALDNNFYIDNKTGSETHFRGPAGADWFVIASGNATATGSVAAVQFRLAQDNKVVFDWNGSASSRTLFYSSGQFVYSTPSGNVFQVSDAGNVLAGTYNKLTFTQPVSGATLALADGSTLATSGAYSTTLTATGATNATLPAGTHSLAPLDAPAFTGSVNLDGVLILQHAGAFNDFFNGSGTEAIAMSAGASYFSTDAFTFRNSAHSATYLALTSTGAVFNAGISAASLVITGGSATGNGAFSQYGAINANEIGVTLGRSGLASGNAVIQAVQNAVGAAPLSLNPSGGTVLIGAGLKAAALPTSCSGQPTGMLWNNSNIVNICP